MCVMAMHIPLPTKMRLQQFYLLSAAALLSTFCPRLRDYERLLFSEACMVILWVESIRWSFESTILNDEIPHSVRIGLSHLK